MYTAYKPARCKGKTAKAAMERVERKRPLAMLNGKHGCCPTCGNLVHKYEEMRVVQACKWCGQALDWRIKQ